MNFGTGRRTLLETGHVNTLDCWQDHRTKIQHHSGTTASPMGRKKSSPASMFCVADED